MQNNFNKEKTKPSEEKRAVSIFTEQEVRSTVKGFVLAWLRGHIEITFPDKEEILRFFKEDVKQDVSAIKATQLEVYTKKNFRDLILICSDVKPATPEEQRKALSDLFNAILIFRSSRRLEGEFLEYNFEERLRRLEGGLAVTNNLVKELIELHRGELELD